MLNNLKKSALVFILVCGFASHCFAADLIYSSGFEIADTYPFAQAAQVSCDAHEAATEVVTSYDAATEANWTPRTGDYMFLQNDSRFIMDPTVPGITGTTDQNVNASNDIGRNGGFCDTSGPFDIGVSIPGDEIYISFYARLSGGWDDDIVNGGRCKWVKFETNDSSHDIFWHLWTDNEGSELHYDNVTRDTATLTDRTDGNWHKYSFYANLDTGRFTAWYDVETETFDNATMDATLGAFGSSNTFDHANIQANFSAQFPSAIMFHAIDDIEVWDGLPTSNGSSSPSQARGSFSLGQ